MTPRELCALPEVACPEGGVSECCSCLYYGRRVCSFPANTHLWILVRLYRKMGTGKLQDRKERALIDDLGKALRRLKRRSL